MAPDLDPETKLKVYLLIVNRYKTLISKQEERSVSEIRQRVSPYNDLIRSVRDRLISEFQPYAHERDFLQAAQRAIEYVKKIKTCRFLLTFWMSFEEIEELKVAGIMDKALFLTALLRSLDSKDVQVMVTKKERVFVGFEWNGEKHLFIPESGSLLRGEDTMKLLAEDPLSYSFSDLVYENYEEE